MAGSAATAEPVPRRVPSNSPAQEIPLLSTAAYSLMVATVAVPAPAAAAGSVAWPAAAAVRAAMAAPAQQAASWPWHLLTRMLRTETSISASMPTAVLAPTEAAAGSDRQ